MSNWEYKVEKLNASLAANGRIEQLLNGYGKDGWELVNIVPQYSSSSNDNHQIDDIWVESNSFIFKRKK